MSDFHELIEASIPCLRHHGGAWANCTLIYCLECGKDIIRDCEREGECDKCEDTYELSDKTNRCGECGNCNNCCTHEREDN